MNLYGYVENNPVNAIDPSGFCRSKLWWEKLEDGDYVGTQRGEYAAEWYAAQYDKTHNPLYIAGGLFSSLWTPKTWKETALTVSTASVGSSASGGKSIAQVTLNRAEGLAFENGALAGRGIAANTEMVAGRTLSGDVRNTVFDSMEGGLTEVKNVVYQSYTKQLQAQVSYARVSGQNYELIVNTGTKVSKPLQGAIKNIGGAITKFDSATGTFVLY